jgi:hypothetical protein
MMEARNKLETKAKRPRNMYQRIVISHLASHGSCALHMYIHRAYILARLFTEAAVWKSADFESDTTSLFKRTRS